MRVEWHGQSAFTLTGADKKVFVDPFADLSPLADRGMQFDYPPIEVDGVLVAAGDRRDVPHHHSNMSCRTRLGSRRSGIASAKPPAHPELALRVPQQQKTRVRGR